MQANTHFPKVRRMMLFLAFFDFNTLLTIFHAASGHLLLPLCLFLRPILKFRSVGAALMRFIWANASEREITFSNFSVTCNGFVNFTRLIGFCDRRQLRLLHEKQPNCRVFDVICTQQVGDSTHDGCHVLQGVATFNRGLCHG